MAVTKSTRIVRSFLCVFHLQRKNYWLIKTDFALKGNEYRLLTGLFLDPGMVTYFHYPSIRLLLSVMPRLHEENLSLPFLTKLGEPFTRETKSWLEYRRLTSQAVGSPFSIVGSHFQPSQLPAGRGNLYGGGETIRARMSAVISSWESRINFFLI